MCYSEPGGEREEEKGRNEVVHHSDGNYLYILPTLFKRSALPT